MKSKKIYKLILSLFLALDKPKMDSVNKARQRLWGLYPKVFATCGNEAAVYGQCVAKYLGEVQKGQCEVEFQNFKVCIQKNAKKMGGKL